MNLFIPYVFTTIGEEKIKDVIEKQECLGTVKKIDIVERVDNKTGKPFNIAYVHMTEWNRTQHAVDALNQIRNEGKKVVYYTQNKKGPYWSLVEDTYKQETMPPQLVRSNAVSLMTPELNHSDSIPDMMSPVNLIEQFDTEFEAEFDAAFESEIGTVIDAEFETDGLVHESYVTHLENENMMLRNCIIQMQMQAYGGKGM
jgi:hypothetical protein